MTGRSIAEARVIKAWTASYDPALAVRAGEVVTPRREDAEYPGWVWCENADGLGGWLPGSILSEGEVLRDFNTMELSATVGQRVLALEECLGWTWARHADGTEGWIPSNHLAR